MAYWKAEQLLALALMAAARHAGVTLDDVIERFAVSKHTAQRMLRTLEAQFADTTAAVDGEGRQPTRAGCLALAERHGVEREAALELVEQVNEAVAKWPRVAKAVGVRVARIKQVAAGHRPL